MNEQEPLTMEESKWITSLEDTIRKGQKAWLEVGIALSTIRDQKLFVRLGFETFKDYCQSTWKWSDKRAYQLIAAAEESSTTGRTFSTEREARESRKERTQAARKPICDTPAKNPPPVLDVDPADLPHDHDHLEAPHITQPTIDAQWKAATGNVKLEPEIPAHIVALIDELKLCRDNCDCFIDCVKSQDCEPDSIKDAAKHLKKLAALLLAYAAEISE